MKGKENRQGDQSQPREAMACVMGGWHLDQRKVAGFQRCLGRRLLGNGCGVVGGEGTQDDSQAPNLAKLSSEYQCGLTGQVVVNRGRVGL